MTFTEVVFEVADERYPLCRLTAPPHDASAILRVVDQGDVSGRFRTLITFYGAPAEVDALPREIRASRSGGDVEVVSREAGVVTLRTDAPTDDAGSASVRLLAVMQLLEGFGADTIIEPFLFRQGRVRARLLVPRRVDTQRVLHTLQGVQRSSGFSDFRIIRVTPVNADRYVDLIRRILTPEQEETLRLAASLGYYDTPRRVALDEVAVRMNLSVSPVHKRLRAIEEVLVSAHVEGTRAGRGARRRLPRHATVQLPSSAPAEIAVRARWPQSRISQFVAGSPGARALLQATRVDPARGFAFFLVVLLAPEREYERFLGEFAQSADVAGVDIVDRDRNHCSARVRLRMASGGLTSPWWDAVWGADAIARPFVFEEGEVTVRMLLMRAMPPPEIAERIKRMATLAGWAEYEVISARSADELRIPLHPPEPPTSRQEEVLKIAHALGYYRTPRACTLEHLAATLGVSANAIHKNLSSAESRVVTSYLSAGL